MPPPGGATRRPASWKGGAWAAARDDVLTSLVLPGTPDALLAGHSRTLEAAYREAGGRLADREEGRAPALERSRLSHVFQNYVRPETLAAANAPWSPGRPGSRSRRRRAAAWSPRSTGCGPSSPSRPRSPAQQEVFRIKAGHDLAERHE
jgi:hypothetical protein